MSVKLKSIILFLINFLIIMAFTFLIFNFFISKYIDKMEIEDLNIAYKSFDSIINQESTNMKRTALDWSHWDDTYNFLNGMATEEYIKDNFNYDTLRQLHLDFMVFTDNRGKIYQGITKNLDSKVKNSLIKEIYDKVSITKFKGNNDVHAGLMNISGRLFIVTSSPITTSNEKAKSNGGLIIGRYVDESLIDYINSITSAKIKIDEISNSNRMLVSKIIRNNSNIIEYRQVKDICGSRSVLASISISRNEYNLARFYLSGLTILFLVVLFIIAFLTLFVLNKYILNRLKRVNDFIDKVSKTRDISARLNIRGNDEITWIANTTNKMLEELDTAQKSILKLSYHDKLTGLRNRVYMEDKFNYIDKNSNLDYSIILGDVNGLKLVNDTFGHKEGDRLIFTIGAILKRTCSEDDVIARWGGDEFIILTINKRSCYLINLMQNIKNECNKITDFGFKISITFGSAKRTEGSSAEVVMNLAEERMYRGKLTEVKSSRNATIISLEKTLYEKNRETEEHTLRVKELSIRLGKKINLSNDELNELELLSLLHDIGKIGIPEYILSKPSKLTDEEWELMKRHTEIGYRIAKTTPGLKHVANEILCHHERFDGTGYPQGLKGEEIPILSRIINIVDSFDVMTHERIYKKAFSNKYAVDELKRCSGTQFDPVIAKKFIDILEKDN